MPTQYVGGHLRQKMHAKLTQRGHSTFTWAGPDLQGVEEVDHVGQVGKQGRGVGAAALWRQEAPDQEEHVGRPVPVRDGNRLAAPAALQVWRSEFRFTGLRFEFEIGW